MGGLLKRRRPAHLLRPDQMLHTLASLRLSALLQQGGVWLGVPVELSELLNQCCTGQLDGGPGTGEEVAAVLLPLAGEPVWPGAGAGGGAGAGAGGGAEAASGAGQGTRAAGACGPGPQGGSTQAAVEQTQPQEQQGQEQGQQVRGQGQGQDQQAVQQPPNGGQDPGGSGPEAAAASAEAAAVNTAPTGGQGQGDSGPGQGKGQGQGQAGSGRPPRQRRGSAVGPPAPSPAIAGCALVGVRLTPEEAFFMHHVLGCLQVYEVLPDAPLPPTHQHVRLLDTQALWDAFRALRTNFVTSYAAYHHLKCKGWVPRSGLLYGVDYVVYQLHPAGAHSDFGVLVLPLGQDGIGGPHTPPARWLDLQITNRLVNQVVKRLILLYLVERPGGPGHHTPDCLGSFLVEERIVRRWVPDATRD